MCMDKGYDYPEVHELLEDYGYTIHMRLRGEYRVNCKRILPGHGGLIPLLIDMVYRSNKGLCGRWITHVVEL